ncbi:uncharacterized protein LOC113666484 [Pocillopora damicornis]|uniref:uncharacterized protein LOC113666484 n=1 Tax=Pocillopora damicornis TaxID=46731 RepID=UPI000F552870|nr:uncharacterized protein LOC113666484 [Pocillopora damicornis]
MAESKKPVLIGGRIFRAILEIGGDRMMFDGAGFGTSAEMYYDITLQEAFFDAALEKYEVLILPTIPKKAPVFPKEKSPPMQEYLERASESVPNTSPTNVTEHPALSINAGFSDGLPVGMMIVGRKLDEATILNVARAYEKIRDTTFEPF